MTADELFRLDAQIRAIEGPLAELKRRRAEVYAAVRYGISGLPHTGKPMATVKLPDRIHATLASIGATHFDDVYSIPDEKFMVMRGMGKKGIEVLRKAVA